VVSKRTNRTGPAHFRLRGRAGCPEPEELIIWARKKPGYSGQILPAQPVQDRPPRITRLVALAIRFEDLLRNGVVKDYSELARLGGVSRTRVTQIMNLRNLAPAIQAQLLFQSAGESLIQECGVRRMAEEKEWRRQMKMFRELPITVVAGDPCGSFSPTHFSHRLRNLTVTA
jgi:hypothetical protein